MIYDQIVQNVANELQLPVDLVRKTYRAYWQFVRDTIEQLPLKEDLDEVSFGNLRVNFNIPSLGKLCCTKDRYLGVKKRFKYINKLREKDVKC